MEFSSWMEFFLENPHKPFQKRAFVPDSDSFRLVGKRPVGRWAIQTRPLPSLDPLHSGTAEIEIHTSIAH